MLSPLLDRSPISSVSDCQPVVSLRVNYGTWTETIVLYAAYTSERVGETAKPSCLHIPQPQSASDHTSASCSSPHNPAVTGWGWGQHAW